MIPKEESCLLAKSRLESLWINSSYEKNLPEGTQYYKYIYIYFFHIIYLFNIQILLFI